MGEIRRIGSVVEFSDFSVINPDFTRARCRVMYTGRNRNYTDITEEALNKLIARKGYANVPVVAHLYKGDDGKWRVGGHDSKIVISAEGGYEIVDETVPFGVIPESCNPSFEDVTETSGEVRRYFCVDVILWTHRYNIMDAAKSDTLYFNQSMEISINNYDCDSDYYCVINDFNLSALCLLNHDPYNKENEVEPCFPSSSVAKFELGKLKDEFDVLLEKYRNLSLKEECKMDITQMKSKIDRKYFVLSCDPDAVIAIKKEDFELYEIPYKADTESGEVVFEYGKAVKRFMSVSDKDSGVSFAAFKDYVEEVKTDIVKSAEKTFAEKFEAEKGEVVKGLTDKFNELSAKFEATQAELNKANKVIETYKAAEKQAETDKHKAEIDNVIKTYAGQLENSSEFLLYRASIDYSLTCEQVEQKLLAMIGKQATKAAADGGTANFAFWGSKPDKPVSGKCESARYGDIFARFDV